MLVRARLYVCLCVRACRACRACVNRLCVREKAIVCVCVCVCVSESALREQTRLRKTKTRERERERERETTKRMFGSEGAPEMHASFEKE
jgi:hypothetical protein